MKTRGVVQIRHFRGVCLRSSPQKKIEVVGAINEAAARADARYSVVPLEVIPVNEALPYSVYVRISENYIRIRKYGEVLTSFRVQALASRQVQALYVTEIDWQTFLNSLETELRTLSEIPFENFEAELRTSIKIRNLFLVYSKQWERSGTFAPEQMPRVQKLAFRLCAAMVRHQGLGAALLRRYAEANLYFINHSVNVFIYSIAIGQKQNFGAPDLKMLGLSALMHNLGNILVPKPILYKESELTAPERDAVNAHASNGAFLLGRLGAPREVQLAALQHHERADGSGYPHGRKSSEIHPFAKICQIADVYDALTTIKPYRKEPSSGLEAIQIMTATEGQFDAGILKLVSNK